MSNITQLKNNVITMPGVTVQETPEPAGPETLNAAQELANSISLESALIAIRELRHAGCLDDLKSIRRAADMGMSSIKAAQKRQASKNQA
jgi:hypothetical protein